MEKGNRFWEIDFLRGIAIIMMVLFHILYDLNYFLNYDLDLGKGFWFWFARITAGIFILLVGISLTLSYSRLRLSKAPSFIKYLKRGIKIFSWGLIITVVTLLFVGDGYVRFGVLHLIGISIIISYPLITYRALNLLIGSIIILIGIFLKTITVDIPWLLWLGLRPENFHSVDYTPLFPWFGITLIGIFLGNRFYLNYRRTFRLPDLSSAGIISTSCFLGRNSLLIYLIHQPVLVAVFLALK